MTDGTDRWTRERLLRTAGLAGATVLGGGLGPLAGMANAAASASAKPRRGGTLHLALTDTSASETLDPANPAYGSQFVLFGALYNRLISANYLTWDLHPELAESWDASKDLLKYQIKLRTGVEFHNGKPLTAQDVIWSLRRVLDPKVGSSAYNRAIMSMTRAGLKAVDKHTVEISLTRPDSQLPHLLARAQLVIVPDGANKFTTSTSIGTGPFKLDSWTPATSWSVSRNTNYWEPGLPYLDKIQQVINTDSAARVEGVKSGQFDLAEEVAFSAAKTITGQSGIKLFSFPKGISRLVVMDCSKKPFTDVRVREAFKYAMNRDLAVKSVYAGFAVPTTDLLLPPSDPFYPKGLGVRPYDPEKAKHLLASAGYPDGISLPLAASTVYSGFSELAQAYSQSAAAAGIKATVQLSAPTTYFDQIWLKAPFYMTYWATFFPPDPLWYFYAPKASYNEAHISLPQVTKAFNGVMSTTDRAKQISLTQSVLSLIAHNWGHIVPANAQSPWVGSPKLHGVAGDPPAFRVMLTRAYLDS
jgi:peptide/nickel transport system substrate-binding protein